MDIALHGSPICTWHECTRHVSCDGKLHYLTPNKRSVLGCTHKADLGSLNDYLKDKYNHILRKSTESCTNGVACKHTVMQTRIVCARLPAVFRIDIHDHRPTQEVMFKLLPFDNMTWNYETRGQELRSHMFAREQWFRSILIITWYVGWIGQAWNGWSMMAWDIMGMHSLSRSVTCMLRWETLTRSSPCSLS